MAVVARYKVGNTRITICDDYAVKTQEEKKKILDSISHRLGLALANGAVIKDEPLKFDEELIVVDENWQPINCT